MPKRKRREYEETGYSAAALTGIEYPEDLQAVYDALSPSGKELFEISLGTEDDPDELMTTAEISAEIARRRGTVTQ
ncbi:MAG: hypothetical protein ACREBD_12025 [Blastocatellia bacterium]